MRVCVSCAHCGNPVWARTSEVNRAGKMGMALYCGRECSGLSRRNPNPLTAEERRLAKAEYDRQRQEALGEQLRAEKRAAYYASLRINEDKVRAAQKANRDNRKAEHLEYCRRPEYRATKAEYDRQRRDRINYGPFAESAALLRDVEAEVLSRASRYDLDLEAGKLNKSTRRKREYAKAVSG